MAFRFDHALNLIGCTKKQLQYWRDTGLVEPSAKDGDDDQADLLYSFQDLVELKAVKRMLDEGISLQKIRKTLDFIINTTDITRPLSQCKLVTDGSTIFQICETDGELIDTLKRGQFAFCLALDHISLELNEQVQELASDRELFIQSLLTGEVRSALCDKAG